MSLAIEIIDDFPDKLTAGQIADLTRYAAEMEHDGETKVLGIGPWEWDSDYGWHWNKTGPGGV